MIEPEALADRGQPVLNRLRSEGGLTSERFAAWRRAVMPRLFEPDDDAQEAATRAGISERDEEDRRQDSQAAAYHAEWVTLLKRIDADLARADRLMDIANPPQPKRLENRDLLAAQMAAAGYCVSCARIPDRCIDIAKGRYRDLCRECGEHKAAEGQIPPLELLKKADRLGWKLARALRRAS